MACAGVFNEVRIQKHAETASSTNMVCTKILAEVLILTETIQQLEAVLWHGQECS